MSTTAVSRTHPPRRAGPSQFEKFDQIIAWLFQQSDQSIKGLSSIVDRLARNFRVNLPRDEGEQSRTPILRFINKCDRLARTLHLVVEQVVTVEGGDQTPYVLPEKKSGHAVKDGNADTAQREKLELVLQHIVTTLDYIFNYMEDDIDLLYLYCDWVAVAEARKTPPDAPAKKVFFVVERMKRVHANLERLQTFVLVKHNAPEPSLVEDLIGLQQLWTRGWITDVEFESRKSEVIENMVRAFVTRGRHLQQTQHSASLYIRREKPIEAPPDMPQAQRDAVAKLRMLLDGSFIDVAEYNARAQQVISKWHDERLRQAQLEARRTAQAEADAAAAVEAAAKASAAAAAAAAAASAAAAAAAAQPPPVPAFDTELRDDDTGESDSVLLDDSGATERWSIKPADLTPVRISKPLPTPVEPKAPASPLGGSVSPQQPLSLAGSVDELSMSPSSLARAEPRNNDPDVAMAKLAAALEAQEARKQQQRTGGQSPAPATPVSPSTPTSMPTSAKLAAANRRPLSRVLSGGADMQGNRLSLGLKKSLDKRTVAASPENVGSSSPPVVGGSSGSLTSGTSNNNNSSSSSSASVFDDLSALQMVAKSRHDPDAYRVHLAEKKLGKGKKPDTIQLKACVDKTYVTDGNSLTVKLLVANQSKKPVNCVKFILQTGAEETVVHEVEDATRDLSQGTEEPIFPLIRRTWAGEVLYMLPNNVQPGLHRLRVQLFYNTRFNIEVPIALHVLSADDMWRHNPLQLFGVPLDEALDREGALLPSAIVKPLEALLAAPSLLATEGIFRMSGDLAKILALRDDMDSGRKPDFAAILLSSAAALHTVVGVLKLWVRLLPQPLLGEEQYDDLLAACAETKGQDMAAKVAAYKPICARVPASNRRVLATLCHFFNHHVVPLVESNKMTHANLSIVFGPVFCWRANLSPMEELSNASRVNGCVKELIEAAAELFPEVQPVQGLKPVTPAVVRPKPAYARGESPATTPASPASTKRFLMGTGRVGRPESPATQRKSTDDEVLKKPSKPLPLLPRSHMLQQSVVEDEEEEESQDMHL